MDNIFGCPFKVLRCLDTAVEGAAFPDGSVGKESTHNAGDPGLIPGSGKPLEKEMATRSSILAWRISWTEEPAGFSEPVGTQLSTQEHIHIGSYSRRSSFVRIVY